MINNNKILTISIAAYNAEKYLDDCLSSIVKIKNIETLDIIIINDGSTDNTLKIANNYKNKYPYVICIVDKKNDGWGSTVNASLKKAKGKYFKILDADDLYDTKNLDDFIEFLSDNDADIICSPFQYFYKNDTKNKKDADKNTIQMHRYTFKTDLLKNNNIFITEKCYYTDIELTLKAIKYARSYNNYDKNIYLYRIGDKNQSVSDESYKKNVDQYFTVMSNLIINEYSSIIDVDIKNIYKMRLVEMVEKYYSILFKFDATKDNKRKIIDFDNWLKSVNCELYDAISLCRVKKIRKNPNNYYWLHFILKLRSNIYNLIKNM